MFEVEGQPCDPKNTGDALAHVEVLEDSLMKFRAPRYLVSALVAVAITISISACGSGRSADKPDAPAAEAAAPAAAVTTPPAGGVPPQAVPPPAEAPETAPAVSKPTKPAPSKPKPPVPTQTERALAPRPEPVVKTVAAGTELDLEFLAGASSKTSHAGDPVRARFTRAVLVDGVTVIPEGAIATGTVTEALPLKKIGGTASLGLKFDTLELGGGATAAIAANFRQQGKSETGKDAGTIAGATAGGALLGRLLSKNDKTKGTLIGAVVGAAAGTGVAASTKGQEIELPVGTKVALHLDTPLTLTVQPST
jgi:glycine zipper 2TM protein